MHGFALGPLCQSPHLICMKVSKGVKGAVFRDLRPLWGPVYCHLPSRSWQPAEAGSWTTLQFPSFFFSLGPVAGGKWVSYHHITQCLGGHGFWVRQSWV